MIGEAGISHESDTVPVAQPIVPDKASFTLHVHASNVTIYRLSGHPGGERVAEYGSVRIGDIEYPAP